MSHLNNGSSYKNRSKNLSKNSVGTEEISKLGSLNSEDKEFLKTEHPQYLKNPKSVKR